MYLLHFLCGLGSHLIFHHYPCSKQLHPQQLPHSEVSSLARSSHFPPPLFSNYFFLLSSHYGIHLNNYLEIVCVCVCVCVCMDVATCWAGRVWVRPLSGARRLTSQCNLQRSPIAIARTLIFLQICTHARVTHALDRLHYFT